MKKVYLLLAFCCLSLSGFSAVWYSQGATAVNTLTNWNSLAGGGGTTPATFANAGDTWIVQTNMNMPAGTWTIGGSLVVATGGQFIKTAGGATTINIGDSLTVNTGGTITTGAGAGNPIINISGDITVLGTGIITTGAAGIYNYFNLVNTGTSLASPQHIYWTSTAASLRTGINISTGVTAQLSTDFPCPQGSDVGEVISGTLDCGTFVMSSGGTNAFAVNAGAAMLTANTGGINGSVTLMASTSFSGAANYTFNGAAAQVTGTFLPAVILSGGSVRINNPLGVTLSQSTDINSGATLTLTNGALTIGANNLILGATATLAGTFSSTAMIVATGTGTVQKIMTGTGSFTYPVGDGAGPNYSPITLNFTSGTFGGGAYAAVNLRNVKHPNNANAGNYINRYWSVTTSGITAPAYNASATYVLSDVVGTEANISAGLYTSALPWIKYGSTTVATHTLTTGTIATTAGDISGIATALPSVTASAGVAICDGQNALVSVASSSGDPVLTFTWAPGSSLSTTVGPTAVASPTTTTTYTVTVTDGNGFTAFATTTITVNAVPGPIAGNNNVCIGLATTLTGAPTGGTWLSTVPANATVDASGSVSGIAAGTTVISYVLAGCAATMTMTVNTPPAPVTGGAICPAANITLTDAVPGGVWSSLDATVTVGSATGLVTGISAGTALISYTVPTCIPATAVVTINPFPPAVSGSPAVCENGITLLTNSLGGGTWSSSAPANATVGSATGDVTGILTGPVTIYYTVASCATSFVMTVNPAPAAITGANPVCVGNTVNLSDITGTGTWSSSATSVATINATTGDVTGIAPGVTTISYILNSTGCWALYSETVNSTPVPITGPSMLCTGLSYNFSDASGGGTWSSSVPAVASVVVLTGVVTGNGAGTADITYTTSANCFVVQNVTVNTSPSSIIAPTTVLCAGDSVTMFDPTPSGVWSTSAFYIADVGSSSGKVYGVAGGGTATISYTISNGCSAILVVTVVTAPSMIVGDSLLCDSFQITLMDSVAGGIWTSSAPGSAIAYPTTGVIEGVAPGVVTIFYTITGCPAVSHNVTVNPNPTPITGSPSLCNGVEGNLFNLMTGGTWSSADVSIAIAGSSTTPGTGIATGISLGTTTISYIMPSGCFSTLSVTVNPLAPPISGTDTICATGTAWLTDIVGGGTWSSSNPAVATIDPITGLLTGLVTGITYIVYTLPTGCTASLLETGIPAVPPISSPSHVCTGSFIPLTDAQAGGTWSTSNIFVATIDTNGILAGLYPDTVVVTYTISAFKGCLSTATIEVNPLPVPVVTYNYPAHTLSTSGFYTGYQWYNHRTGLIPGASGATYSLPHSNDSLRVMVTDTNGCSGYSAWFYYNYTGVGNVNAVSARIFPNPATATVFIESTVAVRAVISSIDGKMVMEQANAKEMDISKLASGLYVIALYDEEGQQLLIQKLVKE